MTKTVRIENADTQQYKVVVEVWETKRDPEDETKTISWKVETHRLDYPTALKEISIWKGRSLLIREED